MPKIEKTKTDPKEEKITMKELADRLAKTVNTFAGELETRDGRLNGHDVGLKDHEERLTKLEEAVQKQQTAVPTNPAPAPADPEPEPAPQPQPQGKQPEPAPQPQAKQPEPQPTKVMEAGKNGPGRAYIYWDWRTRTYGITSDFWGAKQLSNDIPEPVWVWYKNGQIDHELSHEEMVKYTPSSR